MSLYVQLDIYLIYKNALDLYICQMQGTCLNRQYLKLKGRMKKGLNTFCCCPVFKAKIKGIE